VVVGAMGNRSDHHSHVLLQIRTYRPDLSLRGRA
jgi:hypothetical protein